MNGWWQVVKKEEGGKVSPLWSFPVSEVGALSTELLSGHARRFGRDGRVLFQQQSVQTTPVTRVWAEWKGDRRAFYVYGLERRVFWPQYYVTSCGCCSVM